MARSASNGAPVCPACSGAACQPFAEKLGYGLSRCRSCGTIATFPRPDPSTLAAVYDRYYDGASFTIPDVIARTLSRVVEGMDAVRKTGRWLDVGFGEGALLSVAAARGWDCYGVEVAAAALEHGRRQGWTVTHQPEGDARYPAAGFDVVSLIEVLEHVPDPAALLQSAAAWLRPGGVLYMTTPNANSINRRLLGAGWSIVDPPDHLVIWTAPGLRRLLDAQGLRITEVRAEGFNPYELRRRYLPARKPVPVDRNKTGVALNTAMAATPSRRALKAAINRFLTAFELGDPLKVTARRPAEPTRNA